MSEIFAVILAVMFIIVIALVITFAMFVISEVFYRIMGEFDPIDYAADKIVQLINRRRK